ncbi:hypothetical protein CBM2609_P350008 [Cupriavidus taiwanensis]|uniref:Uncharacterized protein n=1 Tax=Cupriavidus taiwanensis TaxID=164546 RepID=A0A7Z7JI59_9BURK|nr:hypothetical protein CBM2592_P380008 [Cupriavidus taiwanensis]SOZ00565.1 hypothetical protein CBM2591_P380008 [Cupriavidus taiwanensis]SOZ07006.1 hypothetical protein CBM2599_P350009 [Cupriavidus taiwanensis]SOZ21637.1 hypothetical protein CBM2604_P370005 [Cupriavidus taiwanensis]SOZ32740.1 hypothetical protein CBM2608_P360008 [Cupriavidus taiwanensis]
MKPLASQFHGNACFLASRADPTLVGGNVQSPLLQPRWPGALGACRRASLTAEGDTDYHCVPRAGTLARWGHPAHHELSVKRRVNDAGEQGEYLAADRLASRLTSQRM